MSLSDSQYSQCCDYLDELFVGLIFKRRRENKEYIFTISRSLMGERLFSSFKPLFQYSSYLEDTTTLQFNFQNLPENSPLLTKEGLLHAYQEIPGKFARYIIGDAPEMSVYEREHFSQSFQDALMFLPGKRTADLKWLVQQHIDRYQQLFIEAGSYKEKNAILLQMNNLYNITRNSAKLTQLMRDKEKPQPVYEEVKAQAEKPVFPRIPYKEESRHKEEAKHKEEPRSEKEDHAEKVNIRFPHVKSGGISLSSLFGILIGFVMILWSIYSETNAYRIFLCLDSFIFVLGATMACTMISYHGHYIVRALIEILQIFIPTHVNPSSLLSDVETLLKWSQKFKAHQQENRPFNQLEELFSNYKDPDAAFMQTAISYLLENYKSEKLKNILDNLITTMFNRSQVQVNIIRAMGNISAIFGVLGALMGFILALSKGYDETNQLLYAIAASLVPMVYGFIFAYLIFKPAARKLEQKNHMRRFRNQLLSCGFVMLSENSSALEIQDTLNSFLEPKNHFHVVNKF